MLFVFSSHLSCTPGYKLVCPYTESDDCTRRLLQGRSQSTSSRSQPGGSTSQSSSHCSTESYASGTNTRILLLRDVHQSAVRQYQRRDPNLEIPSIFTVITVRSCLTIETVEKSGKMNNRPKAECRLASTTVLQWPDNLVCSKRAGHVLRLTDATHSLRNPMHLPFPRGSREDLSSG